MEEISKNNNNENGDIDCKEEMKTIVTIENGEEKEEKEDEEEAVYEANPKELLGCPGTFVDMHSITNEHSRLDVRYIYI